MEKRFVIYLVLNDKEGGTNNYPHQVLVGPFFS